MKCLRGILCFSIFFIASGCAVEEHKSAVISIYLDTTGIQPGIDYSPLRKILKSGVSGGTVDMKHYRVFELEGILTQQLKNMAVTGPTTSPALFPSKNQLLAYWLNARTAWTFKFTVIRNEADDSGEMIPLPGDFPLDGRRMTLEQIDSELLRLGGYAYLISAPGLPPDRAPLPKEPFGPENLSRQSLDNFNAFIDDPKRFVIDIQNRTILVPPLIWKYRERFSTFYSHNFGYRGQAPLTTTLLPITSGSARRRLQDAIGYNCRQKDAK